MARKCAISASVGPNVAWARKRAESESLNGPAVMPWNPSWNSGSGAWLSDCADAADASVTPQTSEINRTARQQADARIGFGIGLPHQRPGDCSSQILKKS